MRSMLPPMSEPPASPDSSEASGASELDEAPDASEATSEATSAAAAAQAFEELDPEAVLADADLGPTPVGFIVGIAAAAVCAFVAVGIDAVQSFADGDGPAPVAIALPLALLPVPLLILVVLWADRLEPEPRQNLAFAFAWGAGIAALSALIINSADLEYVTMPALGASTGQYVAVTFGAPVVEETMKGLVLFGLLWRRRSELDGPTDGVIYAAMVGLGFAMVENVGYYISAIDAPERGGIALLGYTFVLRGLLSPLLHPIFTSMTGLGVAYAASRPRGSGSARWAVFLGWLAAVVLHSTWNGLSLLGAAGLVGGYLIMSCVFGGLILVLVWDRRRMVGLILRYLPGYAYTGLLTPDDVGMLASLRARAAARSWARTTGGLPAVAAMGDYQLAATELAFARAKSARGVLSSTAFADRERKLLALMRVARHWFARRVPPDPEAPAPWATAGSALAPDSGVSSLIKAPTAAMERTVAPPLPARENHVIDGGRW
jgi:RsiW-degrading membrane proteinase PrsW (M82 family)